ncbi:MAG: hypothetical protein H0V88_02995 [Pyrinomonadaceae bacterium]|nr:hypothetical protein [Pyrinomonadaceae bacterium]
MQTGSGAIAKVFESACEDQKIEVAIEQRDGVSSVMLRHLTWTDGLGWCSQKTIRLQADQLDDLHRALTVARYRINQQQADAGQKLGGRGQVIQLPTLD